MKIFNTSFANRDSERRVNHGYPWSPPDLAYLTACFKEGDNLENLCVKLKRSAAGVIPKLKSLGLITYLGDDKYAYAETPTKPTQETIMSKDTSGFKTVPFYNGQAADSLSDDAILTALETLAAKKRHLDTISLPFASQKVAAMKKKLEEDAADLLTYWEARA